MQLWTEYEGLTIEGAFPLKKLLLPEGRSAFFSTANGDGEPVLVRLIECHFDQEEILARWHSLQALGHPNFLKQEQFGKLVLDDGPVVYAVFEKTDANLAEVLERGRLGKDDVVQLATSLASALEVLHTHGFVHEHMEAGNVFEAGEVVKLRVDCIREAREGEAGAAAKERDVHGLATLLLQALTQKRTLAEAAKEPPLPSPFDQIVRYGMTGAWGLTEIQAALASGTRSRAASVAPQPARPRPGVQRSAPATVSDEEHTERSRPQPGGKNTNTPDPKNRRAMQPGGVPSSGVRYPWLSEASGDGKEAPAAGPDAERPVAPNVERKQARESIADRGPVRFGQQRLDFDRLPEIPFAAARREAESFSLRARWMGAAALLLVVCFAVGWLYAKVHRGHSGPARAASSQAALPREHRSHAASAALPAPAKRIGSPAARPQESGARTQWRVIAFTYDHAGEAQKKAAALAEKYPALQPQVFSPRGRRPYLVTLGGVMSRDEAYALARRLRRSGLPRDTYAQNYRTSP
jgi:hypothetical protein